jgi:hypothetical protein
MSNQPTHQKNKKRTTNKMENPKKSKRKRPFQRSREIHNLHDFDCDSKEKGMPQTPVRVFLSLYAIARSFPSFPSFLLCKDVFISFDFDFLFASLRFASFAS